MLWEHVKDMARHSGYTLDFGVGFLVYIWAHENSYLVFFFFDSTKRIPSPVPGT